MWPRRRPFVCTPVPRHPCENPSFLPIFEDSLISQHRLTGYNERLSRINPVRTSPARSSPLEQAAKHTTFVC